MEGFIRPGIGNENWVSRTNYPGPGTIPTGPAEMSIYVTRHYSQTSCHIARYTLRLDGFASVNAPYGGGEMLTRLLRFSGNTFRINYATSAAGSIQVEIQDETGAALRGFSLEECPKVIGNEIERIVSWKNGADLSSIEGQSIRLRFVMKDADLYSIRFGARERYLMPVRFSVIPLPLRWPMRFGSITAPIAGKLRVRWPSICRSLIPTITSAASDPAFISQVGCYACYERLVLVVVLHDHHKVADCRVRFCLFGESSHNRFQNVRL